MHRTSRAHGAALLTILIWGTTFIATKILLTALTPVEILFLRFALGLAALWLARPQRLRTQNAGQELTLAAAGLCGICLYYLLENIALTYTLASNVGVIISAAPFLTALLECAAAKSCRGLTRWFFVGFVTAMAGICLLSFHGARLAFNPLGDGLALAAALVWACYSLLMQKIAAYGYPTILATRRIFAYGLLFMLPCVALSDTAWNWAALRQPLYLGNLLFLGLGASALCFVTWNYAVKILGPLRTSVYIYLVPVITVTAAAVILREPFTLTTAAGTALAMAGLFISGWKS